jgi:hypothetical protein
MKGGDPATDEAIKLNSIILCAYKKLLKEHSEGTIDNENLNERAAELMLYRIKFSKEKYPVKKYPNPISLRALLRESALESHDRSGFDNKLLSHYVNSDVDCHATVM